MFKQKPFPFSLVALVVLITLHSFGSYYSLYWKFSWFDIVVHIFAGLWIGLLILWLASILGQINSLREYKVKSFMIALVAVLFVGVIWELIENFTQTTFTRDIGYGVNTALDLINDAIGGILAYLYFVRRRKLVKNTEEVLHPFYNQTGIIKS